MLSYGKTARCALASLSYLAKFYKEGSKHGSKEISEAVNISQAVVAKVLTTVSSNDLVTGTRGLNGGYALAKPPSEISVYDVISLFGKMTSNDDFCPMGPGHCGIKDECPLHSTLTEIRHKAICDLKKVSLDIFDASSLS